MEKQVRDTYLALLGRAPDDAGLAHYVEHLKQGKSVADIRRELMASEEYRMRAQAGTPS